MGNAGKGYSNAGGVNFQNQGGSYIAGKNGVGANQLLNSVDSKSFVNNLFTFARSNNILSDGLKKSFDVYADAGATVNGTSIKNIPKLQELYKFVINNPRIIYPQEMVNFLDANIVYENNSNDVTDEEKNQYVFLLNRLRPLSTKLRILNEEYNNRKIDYNTYDKAYTENMDEFEIAHNELEAYKAGLRDKYPQYAPYIKAMPLTRNPSN
jgi:hypothetical protein